MVKMFPSRITYFCGLDKHASSDGLYGMAATEETSGPVAVTGSHAYRHSRGLQCFHGKGHMRVLGCSFFL